MTWQGQRKLTQENEREIHTYKEKKKRKIL